MGHATRRHVAAETKLFPNRSKADSLRLLLRAVFSRCVRAELRYPTSCKRRQFEVIFLSRRLHRRAHGSKFARHSTVTRICLHALTWFAPVALAGCTFCVPISAQSPSDGAIGGRLLTAAGAPVADAVIVAHDEQTSIEERARTGAHGEFLLPRLPVGEYSVAIENEGAVDAQLVHVGLGEVTEIELHLATSGAASGLPSAPVPTEGTRNVPAGELAELPIEAGEWRAAALTISGANAAASTDDGAGDISFRGVDFTQKQHAPRWH